MKTLTSQSISRNTQHLVMGVTTIQGSDSRSSCGNHTLFIIVVQTLYDRKIFKERACSLPTFLVLYLKYVYIYIYTQIISNEFLRWKYFCQVVENVTEICFPRINRNNRRSQTAIKNKSQKKYMVVGYYKGLSIIRMVICATRHIFYGLWKAE